MQLVVPIGYGVWVWCDMTLSIIKLLTVRSWRSDANTVLIQITSETFSFSFCKKLFTGKFSSIPVDNVRVLLLQTDGQTDDALGGNNK